MLSPRNTQMDAIRGVAIVLVVVAHAVTYSALQNHIETGIAHPLGGWIDPAAHASLTVSLIYSFHMPLFAFVSGYVLGLRPMPSPARMTEKKLLSLVVPSLAWAAVTYLVAAQWQLGRGFFPFVRDAVLLSGAGSLWFLQALFWCFVISSLVVAATPRPVWLVASICAVMLIGVVPASPSFIRNVAWLYPAFVGGIMLADPARSRQFWQHRRALLAAAPVVWLSMLALDWPIVLTGGFFTTAGPAIQRALGPIGSSLGMIVAEFASLTVRQVGAAAAIVFIVLATENIPLRLASPLAWLGCKSLGIYATHMLLMRQLALWLAVDDALLMLVVGGALSVTLTLALEQHPATAAVFLGRWPRAKLRSVFPTPQRSR